MKQLIKQQVMFSKAPKMPAFSLGLPAELMELAMVTPEGKVIILDDKQSILQALTKDANKDYVLRPDWDIYPFIKGCTDISKREVTPNTLVQRNTESGAVRSAAKLESFKVLRKDPANPQEQEEYTVVGYDNTDIASSSIETLHNTLGEHVEKALISMGSVPAAVALRKSGYASLRGVTVSVAKRIIVRSHAGYEVFTAYFANPAQVRKGESAYLRMGTMATREEAFALADHSSSHVSKLYARFASQYNLVDFGKVKGDVRIMNSDKDAKRVPLNDGGSRKSILMDRIGPMYLDRELSFVNGAGEKGSVAIYKSVTKVNGETIVFAVGDDLTNLVSQDDALITSVKDGVKEVLPTGAIFGEGIFQYAKNLMDGAWFWDTRIGELLKEEGIVTHEGQGTQGRFPGVKGLGVVTPELFERTGIHAYFGDGAVKLSPAKHLIEGTCHFSVLQTTRLEMEKESSVISTQALLAMETPGQILRELHAISTHKLYASLEDGALALEILGSEDFNNEDDVKAEDLSENPVVRRLQQDHDSLNDGAFRRRYAKLLSKMMEKLAYGAVMAEQVRMRHMITDPYMILTGLESLFRTGRVSYEASVPANCVLAADASGKARTGKVAAVRFPVVSYFEPRLVTALAIEDLPTGAREYYEKYLGLGFFQGLSIFSGFDMVTEAMSGADFDGDTCLFIFNEKLVGAMTDHPMFLDYTSKDGKAPEGGCPFSSPVPALSLEQVMGAAMPQELVGRVKQLENENGLTWNLEFREEDVQAFPEQVFYVWQQMSVAKTIKEAKRAEIGEWSNRTTIAQDILANVRKELAYLEVVNATTEGGVAGYQAKKASLLQEIKELETLIIWLTNAVRWAIDEAKHGGAFKVELASELAIFMEDISPASSPSFEDFAAKYGVSAVRFFAGK